MVINVVDDTTGEATEGLVLLFQRPEGGAPVVVTITIVDDDDSVASPEVELTGPGMGDEMTVRTALYQGWCEYGATVAITYINQPAEFDASVPDANPVDVACEECTPGEHPECGTGPNQRGKFSFTVAYAGPVGPRTVELQQTDLNGNAGGVVAHTVMYAPFPIELRYRKASNPDPSDQFGHSVAIFGDTMVVGAPLEASSSTTINGNQGDDSAPAAGAVYVYVHNNGLWSQQAYLKSPVNSTQDKFGTSVAIFGDTIVVGAPGDDNGTDPVEPGPPPVPGSAMPQPPPLGKPRSGCALVFTRSNGVWTFQKRLRADNYEDDDVFGTAVAISGDTVAVGAPGEDSGTSTINPDDDSATDAGAVYIFTRSANTWTLQRYLKPDVVGAGDGFGSAVALDADNLVVGAPLEDSDDGDPNNNTADAAGAAYVFTRQPGTGNWFPTGYLKPANSDAGDNFGAAVAISFGTAVVGAPNEGSNGTSPFDNSANQAGAAYVFQSNGGPWMQTGYLKAGNTGAGDRFGTSVAVRGLGVAVGAPYESGSGVGINPPLDDNAANAGAVYLFAHLDGTWVQRTYLKAVNTQGGDRFGAAVAMANTDLVVGAPDEDSATNDPQNNGAEESGAACAVR
ncbi:MAG: hypothetical protein AB2A00_06645 [Myxococcota bacterium]